MFHESGINLRRELGIKEVFDCSWVDFCNKILECAVPNKALIQFPVVAASRHKIGLGVFIYSGRIQYPPELGTYIFHYQIYGDLPTAADVLAKDSSLNWVIPCWRCRHELLDLCAGLQQQ